MAFLRKKKNLVISNCTKYILGKHCPVKTITPFVVGHVISLANKVHDFMRYKKPEKNIKSLIRLNFSKEFRDFKM